MFEVGLENPNSLFPKKACHPKINIDCVGKDVTHLVQTHETQVFHIKGKSPRHAI